MFFLFLNVRAAPKQHYRNNRTFCLMLNSSRSGSNVGAMCLRMLAEIISFVFTFSVEHIFKIQPVDRGSLVFKLFYHNMNDLLLN